jgi:hypothetical protein
MAERIPLSKLIRALRALITLGGTADTAFNVSGRAAETPRLVSVPAKKLPAFFIHFALKFLLKHHLDIEAFLTGSCAPNLAKELALNCWSFRFDAIL